MTRRLLWLAWLAGFLWIPVAWSAPSNTMSVTPACTSGTTITCSDETTRNNNISTPYNAHTHTDIAAMSGVNTFTIGDGTLGNKDYCEDGTTDRCLRYNSSADLWTIQQGGANYNEILTFSGTAGITSGSVLVANGTGAITGLTSVAPSDDTALVGDSSTAATWRSLPNCTDTSGNHLNYTQSTNSFSCGTTASSATTSSRVQRTAGDVTISSATLTDLTGASITFTTGANPVVMLFQGDCSSDNATDTVTLNFDIDGTNQVGTAGHIVDIAVASENEDCSFGIETAALTAASHTFKVRWNNTAGGKTATIQGGTDIPYTFSVIEVK